MAGPNIKFDLSQTIKDVSELNGAMQALQGVAQNLFSELGKLTSSFSQNLSQAQSNIPAQGPTGLRDVSQSQFKQNFDFIQSQMALPESQRSVIQSGGFYRQRNVTSQGVQFTSLMSSEEYQKASLENSNVQNVVRAGESQSPILNPQGVPYQNRIASTQTPSMPQSFAGIGYSASDLPRLLNTQSEMPKHLDKLSLAIDNLSKSDDQQSKDMRDALEFVRNQSVEATNNFKTALEEFRRTKDLGAADPQRRQAEENLRTAMGEMEAQKRAVDEANKYGGSGPPGGGGRGRGFMGFMKGAGSAISTVATGVIGGYASFLSAQNTLDGMTYDAFLRAEQGKGEIAAQSFNALMRQADLNNPENLLRAKANLLYPEDYFKYLGTDGLENAIKDSSKMEKTRLGMSERSRDTGFITNAGGTAAATVVGTAIGGPKAGIVAFLTGAAKTYGDYAENEYTRVMGDNSEGVLGDINTFMGDVGSNETDYLLIKDTEAMNYRSVSKQLKDADSFQEAKLKQHPEKILALGDLLQTEGAERTGAVLVGSSAMTRSQVAAMYRSGSRVFENLEMSPAEFMEANAQLQNALAGRAGVAETSRAVRLGRSGLGSFEQILGNLTGISQVAGGQGDQQMARLEKVLASAVSVGFNESRVAQQFVQSTTKLAETIGTTSMGAVGNMLSQTAVALTANPQFNTATGRFEADELGLRRAAQGMSQLAQLTGQEGGLFGMAKIQGSIGSGATIGGGAAIMQGFNIQQMQNFQDVLRSGDQIQDIQLRDLVLLQEDNLRKAGQDPRQARDIVANRLSSMQSTAGAPIRGVFNMISGGNFSEDVSRIKEVGQRQGLNSEAYRQEVQTFGAKLREAGAMSNFGEEAVIAFGMSELMPAGLSPEEQRRQRRMLEQNITGGNSIFGDYGKKSMRRFMDDIIRGEGELTAAAKASDVRKAFEDGTMPEMLLGGQKLTKDIVSKMSDDELNRLIGKEGTGLTRLDLFRAGQNALSLTKEAQPVVINNLQELVGIMMQYMPERNKQTTTGTQAINATKP